MKSRLLSVIGLVVGSALWASAASAVPVTIGLQQAGVNGGAITPMPAISLDGFASYTGAYGSFSLNSISGTAFPNLAQPDMSGISMNIASAGPATLTVYITESFVDFVAILPNLVQFVSSFTTNSLPAGWSVTLATYLDTANQIFGTTGPTASLLASETLTSIGTTVQRSPEFTASGPYSLTQVFTITASGNGDALTTIKLFAIPEPTSLLLIGAGLVGLGWTVRRRRRV